MTRGSPGVASGLAVLVWALAPNATAQEQKALPAFPSRAEVVTLDVVVVDKQGHPVRGLVASDFRVLEDSRPQVVLAFEAIDWSPAPSTAGAPTTAPVVGSPTENAEKPGRAFVFLVDDLGLDPIRGAQGVKNAIAQWVTSRALPADDVAILSTGGSVSWKGRIGRDRDELLVVLGKVRGRRPPGRTGMSEAEAWAISEDAPGARTLGERIAVRWRGAGNCFTGEECRTLVRTTAREVFERASRRLEATLGGIERASLDLAQRPGRKSIVVFSEGFVRGSSRTAEEAAIRASQRANTAVYLVDVRALGFDSNFLPEEDDAPDSVRAMITADSFGVTAAGEYIAEATGGRVLRHTNDLKAGLAGILDESSVYYRLGYQPEKSPDGHWRTLKVEVRRRKVEVRTRRGYYASPPTTMADAASRTKAKAEGDRPTADQTELDRPPNVEVPTPDLAPETETEPAPDLVLATILEKAGAYVEEYGEAFRDVVAEEAYTQWNSGHRQQSRSDLVFVSIPGAIPWTCFRDVFEVDGLRVRERESRLEKLFLAEPRTSALKKADAIIVESAHYNLGARRTINVPTLPLLFLHPDNQNRFRFERKGQRRFGDREAVEIAFAEVARPTLVNDGGGGDVVAVGRIFVDPRDGVVLRTEASFTHPRALGQIAVDYRFDRGLGIWLPEQMQEGYRNPQRAIFDTEATARYARYRRFGVTTDEQRGSSAEVRARCHEAFPG